LIIVYFDLNGIPRCMEHIYFTDTPYGSLPVLEYNGETISQSMTMSRFLAREFNLAVKNNVEAAKADAIVDACTDALNRE
jgi:glutathione S-transferase